MIVERTTVMMGNIYFSLTEVIEWILCHKNKDTNAVLRPALIQTQQDSPIIYLSLLMILILC